MKGKLSLENEIKGFSDLHAADVTHAVPFGNWYSGVLRDLIFVMVLIVTISRESNFVYKLTASYTSYPQTSDVTEPLVNTVKLTFNTRCINCYDMFSFPL